MFPFFRKKDGDSSDEDISKQDASSSSVGVPEIPTPDAAASSGIKKDSEVSGEKEVSHEDAMGVPPPPPDADENVPGFPDVDQTEKDDKSGSASISNDGPFNAVSMRAPEKKDDGGFESEDMHDKSHDDGHMNQGKDYLEDENENNSAFDTSLFSLPENERPSLDKSETPSSKGFSEMDYDSDVIDKFESELPKFDGFDKNHDNHENEDMAPPKKGKVIALGADTDDSSDNKSNDKQKAEKKSSMKKATKRTSHKTKLKNDGDSSKDSASGDSVIGVSASAINQDEFVNPDIDDIDMSGLSGSVQPSYKDESAHKKVSDLSKRVSGIHKSVDSKVESMKKTHKDALDQLKKERKSVEKTHKEITKLHKKMEKNHDKMMKKHDSHENKIKEFNDVLKGFKKDQQKIIDKQMKSYVAEIDKQMNKFQGIIDMQKKEQEKLISQNKALVQEKDEFKARFNEMSSLVKQSLFGMKAIIEKDKAVYEEVEEIRSHITRLDDFDDSISSLRKDMKSYDEKVDLCKEEVNANNQRVNMIREKVDMYIKKKGD